MAATVSIELDKRRTLRFDMNTMVLFENEARMSFTKAFSEGGVSFGALRTFLWAGLVHEDAGLSLEAVGTMIEEAPGGNYGEKLKYCFDKCGELMKQATPQDADSGNEESPGTGPEPKK